MDHDVHIAGRFAGGGIGFEKRLKERFGGLDALLLVAASEPSEIEKHRVVMDKTDRQVEHPFPDVFIIDIEGKLALRLSLIHILRTWRNLRGHSRFTDKSRFRDYAVPFFGKGI